MRPHSPCHTKYQYSSEALYQFSANGKWMWCLKRAPRKGQVASSYLKSRATLFAALLVAAVFIVYWPAITAGFVFDDDFLIVHNPSLEASDGLYQIWCTTSNYDYFPLSYTSFLIEHRLWGTWATGYHLVSLVLHAINVLLVWHVLRKLNVPGSWLAALLFAVHPVAASSVAWISEQKNLWSLLFCLTSLSCYIEFQAGGRRRCYALSLIAFLAALLGKTSVVLAPGVMLLCTWWQTGRIRLRDWLLTAPFFLLSLAMALATVWFQFQRAIGDAAIPIGDYFERFRAAGYALWFYLGKDLVPVNLSMIYPRWDYSQLAIWPSLVVLIMGAVFWWFRGGWGRAPLFALGCYAAALLPILGFIKMSFMRYSLVADHFQYAALPVAMAVLGAVCISAGRRSWVAWPAAAIVRLDRIITSSSNPSPSGRGKGEGRQNSEVIFRSSLTVSGAVVLLFGVLSWRQAVVFKNDESLWTETLRQNPDAAVAHANLAKALAERGDLDDALSHFSAAASLDPRNWTWHYDYGSVLMVRGYRDRAVVEFTEAIRLDPENVVSRNKLAQVLTERAIAEYQTAVRLSPLDPRAYIRWSSALNELDRPAEAADRANAALKIDPNSSAAHYELGYALLRLGDADRAAAQYLEAIRLNPSDARAHNNLADLLNHQHKPAEAAKHAQAAIRINPDLAEAHFNLGNAYAEQSMRPEAAREYREAIRLKPNFEQAQANLRLVSGQHPD
jgi:tetratricopeptide (TPR) repeat protein